MSSVRCNCCMSCLITFLQFYFSLPLSRLNPSKTNFSHLPVHWGICASPHHMPKPSQPCFPHRILHWSDSHLFSDNLIYNSIFPSIPTHPSHHPRFSIKTNIKVLAVDSQSAPRFFGFNYLRNPKLTSKTYSSYWKLVIPNVETPNSNRIFKKNPQPFSSIRACILWKEAHTHAAIISGRMAKSWKQRAPVASFILQVAENGKWNENGTIVITTTCGKNWNVI